MGHWGSSISDRLGKSRLLPSPRLGCSPSLQPPKPQYLPAGCDGGVALLGPLSPSLRDQGGRGGSATAAQHPLPRAGAATPLWPLLWLIHG